jgi:M6 family metalloprotease-like protein
MKGRALTSKSALKLLFFSIIIIPLFLQHVGAVAPTPEAIEKWKQEGILDKIIEQYRAFKDAGGCSPDSGLLSMRRTMSASAAGTIDTIRVPVILVDFSDKTFPEGPVAGTPNLFDSILFSDRNKVGRQNPSGSMTDYYFENSYGKLYITGQVFGPYRMPQTYAWYVADNTGLTNSSILARDAAIAANADIDYSQFGTKSTNLYGLVVIHPGIGAETGATDAIWSHKSSLPSGVVLDGVTIRTYDVLPEEYGNVLQPIGTFCHEYGHILNLPDLYDINNNANSEGLGDWSLMSSGNYCGNGRYPSHFDVWSKIRVGFISSANVINVTSNIYQAEIPEVEYNKIVYRINASTATNSEYWLIENRQKVGFDQQLPGKGLCIYHIDPLKTSGGGINTDPNHYGVALEQADGLDALAKGGSRGDAGDAWPYGTLKRSFTDLSTPNSKTWNGVTSEVGVWNISNFDSLMYADLDYEFSRPYILMSGSDSLRYTDSVYGNGDMVIDQDETVELFCRVKNILRNAYNWSMTLESDNPDIEFIDNHVRQSSGNQLLYSATADYAADIPVRFRLRTGSVPKLSNFTLTLHADSVLNSYDEAYSKSFTFALAVGTPNVLIVDDDNGMGYQTVYSSICTRLGVPTSIWDKSTLGSPTAEKLAHFKSVFWVHGKKPTGTLTLDDLSALRTYLDNGGNLAMGSASAAAQLVTLDSTFLRDYLHARYVDSVANGWVFFGLSGGDLGDSIKYIYDGNTATEVFNALKRTQCVLPVYPASQAFTTSSRRNGPSIVGKWAGVTYNGAHKTVFLTFAPEFLSSLDMGGNFMPPDTLIKKILTFFDGATYNPGIHVQEYKPSIGDSLHILENVPEFRWVGMYPLGYKQLQFEVEFGTDQDWTSAELWSPGPIVSDSPKITYAGVPLVDGTTFYSRIRVFDGVMWSPWYESKFRMNTAPTVPVISSPADGSIVLSLPSLTVTNSTDGDSDPLMYSYEVYLDSLLATIQTSANNIPSGTLTTSWLCNFPALENHHVYWRARSFDGYEYSAWSTVANFWQDATQTPPTVPTLIDPPTPDGKPVFTLYPTFNWAISTDIDPFDSVRYKFEISPNSDFSSSYTKDDLLTNTLTLVDSLNYSTHYYWRVTAKDKLDNVSLSSTDFWTWVLGDCNGSHSVDISDLSLIVSYLSGAGGVIEPKFTGDFNKDCSIDIVDLSYLVDYLTEGAGKLLPGCQ